MATVHDRSKNSWFSWIIISTQSQLAKKRKDKKKKKKKKNLNTLAFGAWVCGDLLHGFRFFMNCRSYKPIVKNKSAGFLSSSPRLWTEFPFMFESNRTQKGSLPQRSYQSLTMWKTPHPIGIPLKQPGCRAKPHAKLASLVGYYEGMPYTWMKHLISSPTGRKREDYSGKLTCSTLGRLNRTEEIKV